MRNSNAEFDRLHLPAGCVRDERTVVFGDGAVRELRCGGKAEEPPTDPFALARLRLRYRKLHLQQLTTAFEEMRAAVNASADTEDVHRLIELEQRCQSARRRFLSAQREYEGVAVGVGGGPDQT